MDLPTNEYPIHPIYKEVCQEHQKQLALMYLKTGGVSTPESEYEAITEVRSAADDFSRQFPISETLRSQHIIPNAPRNIKLAVTIFRPLGSKKKILPVIILW